MFETVRIRKGEPVRLDLHTARMRQSAHILGLQPLRWPNKWGPDGLLRVDRFGTHHRAITQPKPLRLLPVPCLVANPSVKMDRPEITALRESAQELGHDDILRTHEGNVIECSFRNVLALQNGTLYAPGPEQGALAGTSRARILEAWTGPVRDELPLHLPGEWVATSVSGACPIMEAGDTKMVGSFHVWCQAVLDA